MFVRWRELQKPMPVTGAHSTTGNALDAAGGAEDTVDVRLGALIETAHMLQSQVRLVACRLMNGTWTSVRDLWLGRQE